jgi:hypothetical protein
MGTALIVTAVPKRTEREYQDSIDNADARTLAAAAFKAGYQDDFGEDAEFGEYAAEMIGAQDPAVIAELAAHAGATKAIREAARNGAQFVLKKMASHGSPVVYDVSRLGGPNMLVVGGSSFGDDPCEEFRNVAVLAAILASSGHDPSPTPSETMEPTS